MRMGRPTHQARRISAFASGERTARTRQQPQRIEQAAIKIDLRVNYSDSFIILSFISTLAFAFSTILTPLTRDNLSIKL